MRLPTKIIDAHLHLWDIDELSYPWLEDVPSIQQSHTIKHYQNTIAELPIEKMVFVQAECLPEQYEKEIELVTESAATDQRIQGIVSWFPIDQNDKEEGLAKLSSHPLIRGIRILEDAETSVYKQAICVETVKLLPTFDLSFDIGLKAHQLPAAVKLSEQCPETMFMLDHLGKPDIRNGKFHSWEEGIKILSSNPKIYCKISGMVTEADLQNWRLDDLKRYFEVVLEQFGPNRLVFGSDWPVVTLAATYQKWYEALLDLCKDFSQDDLDDLFYNNANKFYRL